MCRVRGRGRWEGLGRGYLVRMLGMIDAIPARDRARRCSTLFEVETWWTGTTNQGAV